MTDNLAIHLKLARKLLADFHAAEADHSWQDRMPYWIGCLSSRLEGLADAAEEASR